MAYLGPKRDATLREEFENYMTQAYSGSAVKDSPAYREMRRAFMAGCMAMAMTTRYHADEIKQFAEESRKGKV